MGLVADVEHARAVEPDDLEQLFVKGVNAGDVEAVMTLFERDAAVALSDRSLCMGIEAIRAALDDLVASDGTARCAVTGLRAWWPTWRGCGFVGEGSPGVPLESGRCSTSPTYGDR